MNRLLTINDLLERWQISRATMNKYIKQGFLKPVKGLHPIRFSEEHIMDIECNVKEKPTRKEKMLAMQLEEIRNERDLLANIMHNILIEVSRGVIKLEDIKK